MNLSLIGYYKYADFFIQNINYFGNNDFVLLGIILPLGISFYTFQQIAFLVETYKGTASKSTFLDFVIFVTFFPQLIAGPIVRYSDIMPQLKSSKYIKWDNFEYGMLLFAIGLVKKVIFADYCAEISNPIYSAAKAGLSINSVEAWDACLAYTLQLYFDFSGYCDMAIGIAKIIDIDLPMNFNSLYKSGNIIEFWRRWHMTLSSFLRDYLYIPMGGNRKGILRKYTNLIMTMLIGGLWHGAAWTFVAWGGAHGVGLAINNIWKDILKKLGMDSISKNFAYRILCICVTFVFVSTLWVFFRAETFSAAYSIIAKMYVPDFGNFRNNMFDSNPILPFGLSCGLDFHHFAMLILLLSVFFSVNSSEIVARLRRSKIPSGFVLGVSLFIVLFCTVLLIGRNGSSDFIYFNF